MKKTFRIVTRKSALALWQANWVQTKLKERYPESDIQILGIQTTADNIPETPLHKVGGKGLFVKELEEALLNFKADIAVHSMKDVPADCPPGLEMAAILEREDPRDAFVSIRYTNLDALPSNAMVGTSSLRRQCQISRLRSDLSLLFLRGNVDTRIRKLQNQEYDAIILAVAGLKRLGLIDCIRDYFSVDTLLPAVGQGALGIECRSDDLETKQYVSFLNHLPTAHCVLAERRMNSLLGGSCQLPVAAFASTDETGLLTLQGRVGTLDGMNVLDAKILGDAKNFMEIGEKVAEALFAQGAKEIIDMYS